MPSPRPFRGIEAFARAYVEHADAVRLAALGVIGDRQLAEDVTQDVFLDFWHRPGRYDPARGELRPYLRLRARSRALDLHRAASARMRMEERLIRFAAADATVAPDAAANAAAREQRIALAGAIRDLPRDQREAVALVHLGGLTADEVAVARRIPLGTAKSRVRLGLRKLRGTVARLHDEAPGDGADAPAAA